MKTKIKISSNHISILPIGMFSLCVLVLMNMFLLYSCKKGSGSSGCEPTDTSYFYINAANKAYIPYTGHDTIKLQYNGGPVVSFIGQGRDSGFNQRYALWDPACSSRYLEYLQYFSTKYTSVNWSLPLYITQNIPAGSASSYIVIKFNNCEFSIVSGVFNSGSLHYDLDSLVLGTHTYRKIQFIHFTTDWSSTDKIYYTVQDGIIKIISQGKEWNLIP